MGASTQNRGYSLRSADGAPTFAKPVNASLLFDTLLRCFGAAPAQHPRLSAEDTRAIEGLRVLVAEELTPTP